MSSCSDARSTSARVVSPAFTLSSCRCHPHSTNTSDTQGVRPPRCAGTLAHAIQLVTEVVTETLATAGFGRKQADKAQAAACLLTCGNTVTAVLLGERRMALFR